MTNMILISLDRVRERQYRLIIGELQYGDFMSLARAKELGEHTQSVLLDLQEAGIIAPDIKIKWENNT